MTKKSNYKSKKEQVIGYTLISVSIVILIFIVSYSVKLSQGVAKSIEVPEYELRLEILNASSEKDLDIKMKEYLKSLEFDNVNLTIVESSEFSIKESEHSFLVNRISDSKAAKLFGDKIGISNDDIQTFEYHHNNKQITATLVLGNDSLYYKQIALQKEQP